MATAGEDFDEDESLLELEQEEDDIDAELADVAESDAPEAAKARELLELRSRAQIIVDKKHADGTKVTYTGKIRLFQDFLKANYPNCLDAANKIRFPFPSSSYSITASDIIMSWLTSTSKKKKKDAKGNTMNGFSHISGCVAAINSFFKDAKAPLDAETVLRYSTQLEPSRWLTAFPIPADLGSERWPCCACNH